MRVMSCEKNTGHIFQFVDSRRTKTEATCIHLPFARNHIQHRCHSNLMQMDDDTLTRLISLIPSNLSTLDIRLDVFEFVPTTRRDGVVQLRR
jgi:hypothetical protein